MTYARLRIDVLIVLYLLCNIQVVSAQALQFMNKGEKTTLDPHKYFAFYTHQEDEDCPKLRLIGQISRDSADLIFLKVDELERIICNDEFTDHQIRKYFGKKEMAMHKESINRIDQWRSKKNYKRAGFKSDLGGILMLSGLTTGITGLFIKDKKVRRNLWIASGVQLGVGITFGILSNPQKKYKSASEFENIVFLR